MAAPFKIKSTVRTKFYHVIYGSEKKFSSRSRSVATRVFKPLRDKVEWPEDLKLVRVTTTKETLIVP